jgi:hypothetical protein
MDLLCIVEESQSVNSQNATAKLNTGKTDDYDVFSRGLV